MAEKPTRAEYLSFAVDCDERAARATDHETSGHLRKMATVFRQLAELVLDPGRGRLGR